MSLATEARSYADSAIESGRVSLVTVVEKLQTLPIDARERATVLADDSKELATAALHVALRNAHAVIGAADAVIAALTEELSKRADDLQDESIKTATKLVEDTKTRLAKVHLTDAGELVDAVSSIGQEFAGKAQGRLSAVAEDVKEIGAKAYSTARSADLDVDIDLDQLKATTKEAVDAAFAALVTSFNVYADRGEKVVADLRAKAPVVGSAPKAPAAKKAPAKKAAAKKAPATKAPAKKVVAKVTVPAEKAPAQKVAADNSVPAAENTAE